MTWRLHDVKVIKANIIKSSFPLTRWPRPDWSLHPPGCLHWQSWSCSNRALKTKIWALSDAELTWIYHFYHLSAERYPSPLWWIIYVETKWVPENDEDFRRLNAWIIEMVGRCLQITPEGGWTFFRGRALSTRQREPFPPCYCSSSAADASSHGWLPWLAVCRHKFSWNLSSSEHHAPPLSNDVVLR